MILSVIGGGFILNLTLREWSRTALVLATLATPAAAQVTPSTYPNKSIRFVVPYPPGGTTDIVARGIAIRLAERFGQQVVIDNRGGASTLIGAEAVAKSPPDGYTLLLTTATTMSIIPQLNRDPPYSVKDFAPITSAVKVPFMIAAHPALAVTSMPELIALAKAKPGTIKYSTPGTASTNHLSGALLESMAGIRLLHVPYKGSGPAITAARAGEVDIVITGIATLTPHWKAGRLKLLAIGADERHPSWPEIPSTAEAGLRGYSAGTWFGIVTRAGAPRAVIDRLNREIVAALSAGELKLRLTAIGFDVFTGTPEEFTRFLQNDMAVAATVIKAAGIRASE
jgi:tripartite-type tricarboxylate transporter receptor subunit TctC